MSLITAEVKVDETDIVNVKLGQPAEITIDAIPNKTFKGHVTEIGNTAILRSTGVAASQSAISSQEAKDFKVVVALDNPPDEIRPGLSCTAKITTATRQNVLTIPIQALTVRQKGDLEVKPAGSGTGAQAATKTDPAAEKAKKEEIQGVFVIEGGKAVFRKVETGITGATDIEVLSGLKDGDQIVTGTLPGHPDDQESRPRSKWTTRLRDSRRLRNEKRFHGNGSREGTHPARRATQAGRYRHPHLRSLEDLRHGRPGDPRGFGRRYRDQARRVRRDHGSVRVGQVHPDEPDRLSRHADQGPVLHQRQPGQRDDGRRAGAHPQQGNRLRLPDLQPAAARHVAAQRGAAADLLRDGRGKAPGDGQGGHAAGGSRTAACTTSRTSYRAASGSVSRSPGPW